MSLRLVMDSDWEEKCQLACVNLLAETLGPEIAADASRLAPKDTGALAASVAHGMESTTLVVKASGGAGGREYALWVEEGHRIIAWGHDTGRYQPPRPFLRPALYRER